MDSMALYSPQKHRHVRISQHVEHGRVPRGSVQLPMLVAIESKLSREVTERLGCLVGSKPQLYWPCILPNKVQDTSNDISDRKFDRLGLDKPGSDILDKLNELRTLFHLELLMAVLRRWAVCKAVRFDPYTCLNGPINNTLSTMC